MGNNYIKKLIYIMLPGFLLWGCSQDYTNYYADGEDKGLAIFSNNNNNLMSCFIAGQPWRTFSRTLSGFSVRTNYEVTIERQATATAKDTLIMQWRGYFGTNKNSEGNIRLHLALPSSFTFRDLSALQGKRLSIDSTNGYFETAIYNATTSKGSGSIYFNRARFDSVTVDTYTGNISGLFDADFNSFKVTKGRFDHYISSEQVRL